LIEPRPRGSAREPPEPRWLGPHLLAPRPRLAPKAGREPWIASRLPSFRRPRFGRAPEPRAVEAGVLGLGLIPWPKGMRECTRGV